MNNWRKIRENNHFCYFPREVRPKMLPLDIEMEDFDS